MFPMWALHCTSGNDEKRSVLLVYTACLYFITLTRRLISYKDYVLQLKIYSVRVSRQPSCDLSCVMFQIVQLSLTTHKVWLFAQ